MSLLRFKLINRSWRMLIESKDFIKEHLYHHHHNPCLKEKNHHLIYRVPGNYPPITFLLTSIDDFEVPNKCLQLNCPGLHEAFLIVVYDIMSFNGIICLNLYACSGKQYICIWNPATKKYRFLPQSPSPIIIQQKIIQITMVGFGIDVKANDYKVVNLINSSMNNEKRVEIYSFSTNSWRRLRTIFPSYRYMLGTGMPFNNGTSFCWIREDFIDYQVLCFDFISETFRSLSFPNVEHRIIRPLLGIVRDKITCVFNVDEDSTSETDVWVFTNYGSIDETWVKLCRIHPYSGIHNSMSAVFLSMNGEYVFFKSWNQFYRYNIITEEIKILPSIESFEEVCMGFPPPHPNMYYLFREAILEFKESMLSIW